LNAVRGTQEAVTFTDERIFVVNKRFYSAYRMNRRY
jgi:hypothetical protein